MPEDVFIVTAEFKEKKNYGTCFLCEGFFVTAAHVVREDDEVASRITITIGRSPYPAKIGDTLYPARDVAWLVLETDVNKFQGLIDPKRCANLGHPQVGQDLIGKGYEKGGIGTREGLYEGSDLKDGHHLVMKTNVEVPFGFSGGPAMNKKGEIVGLIEQKSHPKGEIHYTYIIPIDEIQDEQKKRLESSLKEVQRVKEIRRENMELRRNGYRNHFEFLDRPYFPLKMGRWERRRRRPSSEIEGYGLKIADGVSETLKVIALDIAEIFGQLPTPDRLKCLKVIPEKLSINLSVRDYGILDPNKEQLVEIVNRELDSFFEQQKVNRSEIQLDFRGSHEQDDDYSISWDELWIYPLKIDAYVNAPGEEIAKLSIECDGELIGEYGLHDYVRVLKLGTCEYRDIGLNLEYSLIKEVKKSPDSKEIERISIAPTVSDYLQSLPLHIDVKCIDGQNSAPPEFHISSNKPVLSLEENSDAKLTAGFRQVIKIADCGLQLKFIPPDEKPSQVTIDLTFQGFILHDGHTRVNIGSSKELTLDSNGYIDMRKTNTILLPDVAPFAARITHELKDGDYDVLIECVDGELEIRHEGREGRGLTLKANDEPVVLQDRDLIIIGGYSFRLDMATKEDRRLFPNLTWIATLRPPIPEVDIIPGYSPIELNGSDNQVNNLSEFSFGFQRGGSQEPTRNLPCPWISRHHFSLYFRNRFFLRSGWDGIPGKRVYLLNSFEPDGERSELQILDGQERRPLGKEGRIFALPLCYHFKERDLPKEELTPGTPLVVPDPLRTKGHQEGTKAEEEVERRNPEEGHSPLQG